MKLRCCSSVMKDSCVTFCQETSGHGFTHVINHNKAFAIRAIYVLALLITSVLVIYQFQNSVTALANKSMTSEITEVYVESGMRLPQIHICDQKFFKVDRLSELGMDNELASYLLISTSRHVMSHDLYNNTERNAELKTKFRDFLANNNLTMYSLLGEILLTCKDIIASCEKETQTWSSEHCCSEFFTNLTMFTSFGSCISTIPDKIVQGYESRNYGFVVYIRSYDASKLIDFDPNIVKQSFIMTAGIVYAINHDTVPITTAMETAGVFAPKKAGVLNMISRESFDNTNLKDNMLAPYNCADENDSRYLPFVPNYDGYSSQRCNSDKHQTYLQTNSNCSLVSLASKDVKYPLCEPWQVIESMVSDVNDSFTSFMRTGGAACIKNCKTYTYKLTTSAGFLKQKENLADTHSEYLMLNFFFPSFYYNCLTNYPYTWLKWLGEVGGNFGFFMGASIITILEMILFLLGFCFPSKPSLPATEEDQQKSSTTAIEPFTIPEKGWIE